MQKVSLLEACKTIKKHDFICISETYFTSSVETDDNSFRINGYRLIPIDHPLNTKRSDFLIYYKESWAVKMINTSYIQECLLCEVKLDDIEWYNLPCVQYPNQNSSDLYNILFFGFEQLLIYIKWLICKFSWILQCTVKAAKVMLGS